jgi:hypothetical protein
VPPDEINLACADEAGGGEEFAPSHLALTIAEPSVFIADGLFAWEHNEPWNAITEGLGL